MSGKSKEDLIKFKKSTEEEALDLELTKLTKNLKDHTEYWDKEFGELRRKNRRLDILHLIVSSFAIVLFTCMIIWYLKQIFSV